MAAFLTFDDTDDTVTLDSTINFLSEDSWVAETNIDYPVVGSNSTLWLFGLGVYIESQRRVKLRYTPEISFPHFLEEGNNYTIKVVKTSPSLHELFIDGVLVSTLTDDTSGTGGGSNFPRIAGTFGGFRVFNLYSMSLEINGVLTNNWDPALSNGTGTVLIDSVGSNNGTLTNFPTDDSQWGGTDGSSYLPFDGVDDHLTFATPINIPAASGDACAYVWDIEYDGTADQTLFANPASFNDLIRIVSSTEIQYRYGTTTRAYTLTTPLVVGRQILKFKKTGFDSSFYDESDTLLSPVQNSGVNTIHGFGADNQGRNFSSNLYSAKIYSDFAETVLVHEWDVLSSGGTGVTIPDSAGTNDATLNSFSADPWVGDYPSVADTTIPVITASGSDSTTITIGGTAPTFTVTASDDTDGDITANIVVAGDTVDVNTVGTYTITYDVSDAESNAATQVTREVVVQASTLNMTLTGIPDGPQTTFYMNLANNTMASAELTWSSNTASFTGLSVPDGTEVVYGAIGVSNGGLQRGTIS